jgi:DNA-binding winged helix-turn-helix (wHTH) protein
LAVVFEFGDFVLDESAYELRRAGGLLKVDPKIFDLLAYMVKRPGQLVTKNDLVKHVWQGRALSDTVLTGAISRLRKALGTTDAEELVVSVYGRGYRFVGLVRQRASIAPGPDSDSALPDRTKRYVPFVGRSAALRRIEAAVAQARTGRGRIVVIAGEPGIGKTHLAEVSVERGAEDGLRSAWGHCRALENGAPFWPFIQLLRGALRSPSSPAIGAVVEGALASLMPEGNLKETWGADGSGYRMFDAMTRALQALTDDQPWLLVLDDLQWADAASLRFLAYLAPEIAHMNLVLLATIRNTEPFEEDGPFAKILGHRNCEHITLDRLREVDVAEYTALWLGKVESDVSRAVFDKSEGNPFFMVELLRPFWRSVPPADELAVSGPALDIVRQRVQSLSAETAQLLSSAAIVGHEFDLGLLGHVTEHEPDTLLDLLERPRDCKIIVESQESPGHFEFGHDLIRSVLLESLSAREASRLHLRVAEALERRHPVGDGLPRADVVHHYLAATPLGDIGKTVDYARRSALAATQICAHADAAVLLRRGLSALDVGGDPLPRLRCDLLLGLAQCERFSADSRFSERLADAVALAREHGLGDVLAEAGRHMSFGPGFVCLQNARDTLEAADRVLPPDAHALRADVLAHLSWTAPYCWDAERAGTVVARAEALARESNSPEALAFALSAKFYFANGPDTQDLALSIASQIQLFYERRPPFIRTHWAAAGEFTRIVIALQHADMEGVERAITALGAAARELKHAELEWHHQRASVVQRMNLGEFVGMKAALQKLQDRAERQQIFSLQGVRAVDWGVLLRETEGPADQARRENAVVLQESDCPYKWARKVRTLVEFGAPDKAKAALQDLPTEKLARLPHDRDYLATLAHLSVASIATRSLGHAEILYSLLSPYPHFFAADLSMHCDGSVSHFLGTLGRVLGRTREAAKHLEDALDRNERAGFAPSAAHSAYELACTLIAMGGSSGVTRARELLLRVVESTHRMGMAPLSKKAEEQLRTLY